VSLLITFGLISSIRPLAQSQQPLVVVDVAVKPEVVMAGTPLNLEAVLTNHSNEQIVFGWSSSCGFDLGLEIDIRDSRGNQPTPTILLLRAMGKDTGPDGRQLNPEHDGHAHVCLGNGGLRGLQPLGKDGNASPYDTQSSSVDLSQLYELQPGKYTVQVSRTDIKGRTWRSNLATFTVTPNPNYVPETPCTVSGDVLVTVSDPTGAMLSEAVVVVSPEVAGKDAPRLVQTRTGGSGVARAAGVPCGFFDVFVSADKFIPYAHKLYLGQAVLPLKVTLQVWPPWP
jgi:hypothetical protein